jgi:hypothetical protein
MREHASDLYLKSPTRAVPKLGELRGGDVTRPRAADDFATIRARMEELRRERAQTLKDPGDGNDTVPSGRGIVKGTEARQRPENDRWPLVSSSRRYGSGR